MGMYKYIRKAWEKPDKSILRKRMVEWRKSSAIVKVDKPLRIDRARNLGYKAKKGFVVARVRLMRGGRKKPRRRKGRRSKRQTIRKVLKMNYKAVAEQRAARKFKNLEVLNSYWIGKDGIYAFFEVIMVDPKKPEIMNDENLKWIVSSKGRVFKGLTSAGKKYRGLKKGRKKFIKRKGDIR